MSKISPENIALGGRYWLQGKELTVIGRNPYTKNWVAACPEWCMLISELDAEDYEFLEEAR